MIFHGKEEVKITSIFLKIKKRRSSRKHSSKVAIKMLLGWSNFLGNDKIDFITEDISVPHGQTLVKYNLGG